MPFKNINNKLCAIFRGLILSSKLIPKNPFRGGVGGGGEMGGGGGELMKITHLGIVRLSKLLNDFYFSASYKTSLDAARNITGEIFNSFGLAAVN